MLGARKIWSSASSLLVPRNFDLAVTAGERPGEHKKMPASVASLLKVETTKSRGIITQFRTVMVKFSVLAYMLFPFRQCSWYFNSNIKHKRIV